MIVIGLTGGIGSGKSTVADIIKKAGYTVYDMDSRAKQLMSENEAVKQAIIKQFGNEAYLENGAVNTAFLSETVFNGSPEKIMQLNAIVHPAAIDDMMQFVEKALNSADETNEVMIFVESALIFEAELEDGFDYIVMVDAPEETRIKRVMERSGLTRYDINERIKAQLPSEIKKGHADFVIDNSKNLDELSIGTEFIIDLMKDLPPASKFEGGDDGDDDEE